MSDQVRLPAPLVQRRGCRCALSLRSEPRRSRSTDIRFSHNASPAGCVIGLQPQSSPRSSQSARCQFSQQRDASRGSDERALPNGGTLRSLAHTQRREAVSPRRFAGSANTVERRGRGKTTPDAPSIVARALFPPGRAGWTDRPSSVTSLVQLQSRQHFPTHAKDATARHSALLPHGRWRAEPQGARVSACASSRSRSLVSTATRSPWRCRSRLCCHARRIFWGKKSRSLRAAASSRVPICKWPSYSSQANRRTATGCPSLCLGTGCGGTSRVRCSDHTHRAGVGELPWRCF